MPIYEYKCSKCEDSFEKILGFNAPLPSECELCGAKNSINKLISAPSFRLKGGGWYETDFKTGNKKNLMKEDNEEKPKKDKEVAKTKEPNVNSIKASKEDTKKI